MQGKTHVYAIKPYVSILNSSIMYMAVKILIWQGSFDVHLEARVLVISFHKTKMGSRC